MGKKAALEKISREIQECKTCQCGKVGKAVPGEGNAHADIVFIGEPPGKKESETGKPFVGRAGKLLRKLIEEAGLNDEDVYITSPVKYLPEYVTPNIKDIEHGRIHLFQQLGSIKPKIVVLLGNTASFAVLEEKFLFRRPTAKSSIKMGSITLSRIIQLRHCTGQD